MPAKVTLVKIANYVINLLVMWPCGCLYVALFGSRVCIQTVQHTHTKDLLINNSHIFCGIMTGMCRRDDE